MPFCPQCKAEYEKGIQTCSDCQIALVDKLPKEKELENFVKIYSLPGDVYAQMVKEALEDANIECILKSDMFTSGLQVRGSEGTSTDVYVQEPDVEKAKEILHAMVDHL